MSFLRTKIANDDYRISLVIGCIAEDLDKCSDLITSLGDNLQHIQEIICVVSNLPLSKKLNLLEKARLIGKDINILRYEKTIMPGEARNIGTRESSCPFIAFLDVSTKPESNWLENSLQLLKNSGRQGILGRTRYIGKTLFEESFISATYGSKPLFTVPGTLISRNLINEIGHFLPSARCGEDAEWIRRALYFQDSIKNIKAIPLTYYNLIGKKFLELCSKWYRNYYVACYDDLLVYQKQKYFYIIFFSLLAIVTAINWNNYMWSINRTPHLYVPHITKATTFLLLFIYLFVRGILLPLRKGVPLFKKGIKHIFLTLAISINIDCIKVMAFTMASFRRLFSLNNKSS